MSGSGKTVLGKYIYEKLKSTYTNMIFLDGDIFRKMLGDDLGHSLQERRKNAERINQFCREMSLQGVHVIFSLLSLFPEARKWMRQNVENYYEVYIKCPFETLVARDAKGLYKKAQEGKIKNVVGVDIEFPEPKSPDMIIENNAGMDTLYKNGDKAIEHLKPLLR